MPTLTRRDFVKAGTAASLAAAAPSTAFGQGPAVSTRGPFRAVVVASGNGHQYKNGGDKTCVETALRADGQG